MEKKVNRFFYIGSEWLYYKIYAGGRVSEELLTDDLLIAIEQLLNEKLIDKWFFINYNDPERHIRLRLHLNPQKKNVIGKVISTLGDVFSFYFDNKLIHDIQIGTYKRELERYGINTVENFETLFFYNSHLIVNLLKHVKDFPNERWLWCMKSIDFIMSDLEIELKSKKLFFETLKDSFDNEMGANTFVKRQLSKKYRNSKKEIEVFIEKGNPIINNLLNEHKNRIKPVFLSIKEESKKNNSYNLSDKIESYIHMHCNRFFSSKQRVNEWVIYDFLFQYYRSLLARKKNNSTPN